MLKQQPTRNEYSVTPSVHVGGYLSTFYLTKENEKFKGYNSIEWHAKQIPTVITKHFVSKPVEMAKKIIRELAKNIPEITHNPHKNNIAYVRTGNKLSQGEQAYLNVRLPRVKNALERFLQRPLNQKQVPKIALVASGGGYRAMLSTVGSLIAAESIGLLDAVTWLVGLSGSTWAIGSWITSTSRLNTFKQYLITKVRKPFKTINKHEINLLFNSLMTKFAFDQKITFVDIYGSLLANRLLDNFGDTRHRIHLSTQADHIKNGAVPFPIYTATRTGKAITPTWYEFHPYEIGSLALNMYIPTWAYGRRFHAGISVDYPPEQSLGFHFGTFGSAFAADFKTMIDELLSGMDPGKKRDAFAIIFNEMLKTTPVQKTAEKRIKWSWAEIPNFTAGMLQSPIKDQNIIKLTDAGLDFNLPYPPISGKRKSRKADIIVFLDYSGNVESSSEIKKVEQYARNNKLPFPTINYTGLAQRAVSVFKDENNREAPVVIYMPLIKDKALWNTYKNFSAFTHYKQYLDTFDPVTCEQEAFCSTFNFKYRPQEFQQVSLQAEFNLKASKDIIAEAINWTVDHKMKYTKVTLD